MVAAGATHRTSGGPWRAHGSNYGRTLVGAQAPSVAGSPLDELLADVAGALAPHSAELSADIHALIVREIPELRTDSRVLTLLEASVAENVATVLHILQHDIDLDHVRAPAAAEEYGRRLAQRGILLAALLRAHRIGSTRFQHRCLRELARQTDDASIISAAGLRIAETTAAYIDQVSEELVAEEALGHPLDEHRLQVELALLASQWLGATVLRQPGAARR